MTIESGPLAHVVGIVQNRKVRTKQDLMGRTTALEPLADSLRTSLVLQFKDGSELSIGIGSADAEAISEKLR